MRIDDLHVTGFGHFFEQQFGPFESPITVFCGPNEAGKTTLLAFIRAALFGFPRVGREKHYPALRGGQHGGVMHLRDDAGRRYELERGERSFALRDESGAQVDQSDLERLLGHASRDMFESVFAFGIGELQQIELLDKGEAARHIYAAGMGAARLPAALTSLDKARLELFKPGGKNPDVSKKLRELEQVDEAIRECAGDAARFAALNAQRDALEAAIEGARAAAVERVAERTALELQRSAWADWSELAVRRERLLKLPPGPVLPENALARLEALESAVEAARRELEAAEERAGRLAAEADAKVPGAELLRHVETVAALTRRLGDAEHSVKDLRTRTGELRQAEATLADALAELGPGWTPERVTAFDTSFPVRTVIREHDRRLSDAAGAVRDARAAVAQAERSLSTAQGSRAATRARIEDIGEGDRAKVEGRREAIRLARGRLEAANRAADRAALLEQTTPEQLAGVPAPEGMRPRTPIGFAAALVLAAGGLALGGIGLIAGVAAAIVVAGGTSWDAIRHRSAVERPGEPASPGLGAAREAEAMAFAALAESAEALGVDHVSSQRLDELEDALAEAVRAELARAQAIENDEDAAREVTAAEARLDDATKGLAEAERVAGEASAAWAAWLSTTGCLPGLSGPAALDLLARVETAKQQVAGIGERRERIQKIRDDIAAFRALLTPVAAAANIAIENDESLFPTAERVIKRTGEAERAAAERDRQRRQAEEARETVLERERKLAKEESALAALLDSAGAADAAAFRAVAGAADERQKLVARIADLELALTRLCGPAAQVDALDATLAGSTIAQIEQDLDAASAAAKAAADRHTELREERVRVASEIQRLDNGERASRLHAQRAELVEELRAMARKWATLTIAERLLERAREQYQQQRQPAVVAHAQEFFATVTGGRYSRIVAQIGEQAITVHTGDGRAKSPADLSRGTREQLYLALRFGLIRQFNEQATRLPVIVDDILVNFDPERAARTAQAFVELSRTNQVLVFTCHPSTAALFKAASKSTQIVDLSDLRRPQAPRLL